MINNNQYQQKMKRSLSKQHHMESEQERQYQLFQIVWAKVGGYPWWPGKIISWSQESEDSQALKSGNKSNKKKVNSKIYTVLFVKQGSMSSLDSSKIKPYLLDQSSPNINVEMDKQIEQGLQAAINFFNTELKKALKFHESNIEQSLKSNISHEEEQQQSNYSASSESKSIELKKSISAKFKSQKRERRTSFKQRQREISEFEEKDNSIAKNQVIFRSPQKQLKLISHHSISCSKDQSEPIDLSEKNYKRTYLDILIKKGFEKRKALAITKQILRKSKANIELNTWNKLGEEQIAKFLKERTMQQLLNIL